MGCKLDRLSGDGSSADRPDGDSILEPSQKESIEWSCVRGQMGHLGLQRYNPCSIIADPAVKGAFAFGFQG